MKKQKEKESKVQNSAINITNNSIRKVFYSVTYSVSTFTLLLTPDILRSSWMYNTGMNMYITYILDGYIKDRDINLDNYIIINKKPVKVDLYKTSIIAIDTPNNPDTIILTNTAYYLIFLANITSAKCFRLKKVYLNKKYS